MQNCWFGGLNFHHVHVVIHYHDRLIFSFICILGARAGNHSQHQVCITHLAVVHL